MNPLLFLLVLKFGVALASEDDPTESLETTTQKPVSIWEDEYWPAYPERMYILFRQAFLDVANSDAKIAYYFHTMNQPRKLYPPTYNTATPDPEAKMPREMNRFEGFERLFNIVKETHEVRRKRIERLFAEMEATTPTDQTTETTTEDAQTDATSTDATTVEQDFDIYVTSEGDADYISLVSSTEAPEVYVVDKDVASSETTSEVYVVDEADSSTEAQEEVYVVDKDVTSTEGTETEVFVVNDVEVRTDGGGERLSKRSGMFEDESTTTAVPSDSSTEGLDDVTPKYVAIPVTSFTCRDKKYIPGFYADLETGCRIFHVCREKNVKDSFACPDGATFDQATLSCGYNANCSHAPSYYDINAAVENEAKRPSNKMADRLLQDILVAAIENVAADSYKVLE